jgi:uracil-DNA glycosylase
MIFRSTNVDDRRLRAWHALELGPAWIARESGTSVGGTAPGDDSSSGARWMLVGGLPDADADADADVDAEAGEPTLDGAPGRLLDRMLASIGLDRATDVVVSHVAKRSHPDSRDPLSDDTERSGPGLERQIALARPQLILALGEAAAQSLLKTDAPLASLRGRVHPYRSGSIEVPLVVTFHPADLLHNPADKSRAWADLCLARAVTRDERPA